MKLLVSLTCTLCPELVMAAQRMTAENPRITAEAYDLNHFPELREKYKVMSVPCLVINDRIVSFGKKNIRELFAFLG
jgi:thioredoxin reductase (NADPH)